MAQVDKIKDKNNFERNIALIMGVCGIVANLAGALVSILRLSPGEILWHRQLNITSCTSSLIILIILTLVFFKKKKYGIYSVVATLLTGYVLFPTMFITSGNINESFMLYMLLIPTAYGVSARTFFHKFLAIFNLVVYLALFIISYKGFFNIYPTGASTPTFSKAPLYTGFTMTYIFAFMVTEVAVKTTRDQIRKYRELSSRDALTHTYNRGSLDKELMNIKLYKYGIMIDIDHFKNINDTFGHSKGDEALINLVSIINDFCCNEFEVYRYGGEEFFILSRFDEEETFRRIRSIYSNIHAILRVVGQPITISCGVSENIKNDAEDFVKEADAQMYTAKHSGRDRAFYLGKEIPLNY